MSYQIITAYKPDKLADRVNAAISDGWEPKGGISVTAWTDKYLPADEHWELYAQAMVRPYESEVRPFKAPKQTKAYAGV